MKIKRLLKNGDPVAAQPEAGTRGPVNPAQRILVADDDVLLRQLSARTLLDSGYEVDTAEDGAMAWESLQIEHYDLLLTDHNMPLITGVELVQKLWAARMILPVILVSGTPPTDEIRQHPWLKFSAILAKPFSTEALLATVKAALRAPDDAHHHAAGCSFPRRQRPAALPAGSRRSSAASRKPNDWIVCATPATTKGSEAVGGSRIGDSLSECSKPALGFTSAV